MLSEKARLAHIRAQLAAIAPGEWFRAHDAEGAFVEARGPMGELLPLLRFHPGATAEEEAFVTNAPTNIRFLLGLVDRAIAALRPPETQKNGKAGKDYAAQAAMKCAEPAFKVFLEEKHGLQRPLTDERVAQRVRSLCRVSSRRELNSDGQAAARWKALLDAYEAWRRAG